MLENNKELFASFKEIHTKYALNPDEFQERFNQEGEKILKIIREWEGKLCMQSEKSGFGAFTSSLAEKFQSEVRFHFPKIDGVGLIRNKAQVRSRDIFEIKKISL